METLPDGQLDSSRFVSTEKVQGAEIYNLAGDCLGRIEHLMIDRYTGEVVFAVVHFGGFLGIGVHRRAIPWSVLTFQRQANRYIVDAEDDVIRATPDLAAEDDYSDPSWIKSLFDHYQANGERPRR